ncbi:MAG: alpha-1,4-glucan--maltose-1-phosphate maltosyltransferase [Elusimicrobia bacterium RIFCSPLOWO2_12_FULL_59_9]|nr:MAG: alpha-1,4-glucan--maltose-1-phosphate maltosyltransferase [Elusimicrobia bacterium RIFCSPLOWO2_12_FULL_59_9]
MAAQESGFKRQTAANFSRVVIENVAPEIEEGAFPVKRVPGEAVRVEADIFADGHDELSAALLYRPRSEPKWIEVPMRPLGNDRWRAEFAVTGREDYLYTLKAWVDPLRTWLRDLKKRIEAAQDVAADLRIGATLIEAASKRAPAQDARRLRAWAAEISGEGEIKNRAQIALDADLGELAARFPSKRGCVSYGRVLEARVDREKARFSSWYELFPRSWNAGPGRHGNLRDVIDRLPYIAHMGFDVLYLPPIHPIGRTRRKGKNNSLDCKPEDPGSPWAIGSAEGGHCSIHPQLGTLEDFQTLFRKAQEQGLELALDIALQCSPDHPYLKEHPEWFRRRPDGTFQCAENPPKKYEDITPFNFECEKRMELWQEMKNIFLYWAAQGIRIFRVDNPHTKPLRFWEWLIAEVRREHPDSIFLSEAFTRPKVMYRLAKAGFNQSYNYFPWRNNKKELTDYFTELTQTPIREFFRPNLWTNTPDILTEYLQYGGRPAFMIRVVLAGTLGASYGIYGPAFELCEGRAKGPGQEEYLDSEKYELRRWDFESPHSLKDLIARLNRVRRGNPALQSDWSLRFHRVDNDQLLCYSKRSGDNVILAVVNLDPRHQQSGWIDLSPEEFGLDGQQPYQMHDLLTDARYLWRGPRNYVELSPEVCPAHIFRLRRRVRSEHDFDYFL